MPHRVWEVLTAGTGPQARLDWAKHGLFVWVLALELEP
jgi:hypothetical protein